MLEILPAECVKAFLSTWVGASVEADDRRISPPIFPDHHRLLSISNLLPLRCYSRLL